MAYNFANTSVASILADLEARAASLEGATPPTPPPPPPPPPAAAPAFTTQPSISGTAMAGQTLTGSDGVITNGTVSARQWLRGTTAISGATGAIYAVVAEDVGTTLAYRVTATGSGGSTTATSPNTAIVQPAPTPPPPPPPSPPPALNIASAPSPMTVAEDAAVNTLVATFSLQNGTATSWQLTDDGLGDYFVLNSLGATAELRTAKALLASSPTVVVTALLSGDQTHGQSFGVTITDVANYPPVAVNDSGTTLIALGMI